MEESVVLLEKTPVHHSSEDGPPSMQAASDKIGIILSSAKTTSSHPAIRNSTSSTELPNLADMDSIADVCLVGSTATVTLSSSSQTSTDQSNINMIKGSATKSETLPASAHVLSSVSGKADDLPVTSTSTGINNVTIPKKNTCHNHNEASVSGKAGDLTVTSKSSGINNLPIPKRTTCQKEASKHPPVGLSLAVMSSSSSGEYISRKTRTFAPPGSSLISSTKHSPKGSLTSIIPSTEHFSSGLLVSAVSSSISSTKHSTLGTLTSIIQSNIASTEQGSSGSLVSAVSTSIPSTEHLTKTEENIMLSTETEKLSSSQNPTSYKKEHCYTKSSPETMSNANAMETETTVEVDTTKRDVEFVSEENEHFAPSHVQLDNSQPSTPTSLDSIMSFSLSNNDSNDGSFYMEVDVIDNERNDDRDDADGSHLSAELKTKLSKSRYT